MMQPVRRVLLISALPLLVLTACTDDNSVAGSTTDAVVFVGKTAVKGVYGASRLVVRGAASGVKRLQKRTPNYAAGTIVCYNSKGEIYSEALEDNTGKFVCPDPS
ncbi:hypothetical protein [Pseudaestuariivita sp.]|uniref:hypothetical protein n=1 Tax=Pseudaestuariivita sp. TaxID=2211669 RepID=UPI0040592F07